MDLTPPNAASVRSLIEERLEALDDRRGYEETVTIDWRGQKRALPVIAMPVDVLMYNPATHRVRAQRTLDPMRDAELDRNPFGAEAQSYLHQLLVGDPQDPSRKDPAFDALKEDLQEHGQNEPGITTRTGVLINGNTRLAALRELGVELIRVAVLPPDAGHSDLQSIELSLQLRKDHRRDYSFMNLLLAIDERVQAGRPPAEIQRDFRIKSKTFERNRWILDFVRDAIERSKVQGPNGEHFALRLIDFETHQGKLEELHRAYAALKVRDPEAAEALREQRLLAIALGKSKTDVRLIEADFAGRYMKNVLPESPPEPNTPVQIPGTSITAPAPSGQVAALRSLTTRVLQARAVELAPDSAVPPDAAAQARSTIQAIKEAIEPALEQAGKTGRLVKKRFAASDRLADAVEDIDLAIIAVSEARATNNFDPDDLDEVLLRLKASLVRLAQLALRGTGSGIGNGGAEADGIAWLRACTTLG